MLLKAIWLTSLGLSISAILGLLILAVHRHGAARLNRTRTALIETIANEVNQCDGAAELPVDLLLTHIGLLPSVAKRLTPNAKERLINNFPIDRMLSRLQHLDGHINSLNKAKILDVFDYHPAIGQAFFDLLKASFLVRNMAAIWLIEKSPELNVVTMINRLCHAGRPPNRKIIQLLRQQARDDAHWLAMLSLDAPNLPQIITALECLQFPLSASQQQRLLVYLAHDNPDVRAQAWRAVGSNHYSETQVLLSGFDDESIWFVRTQMAYAAGVLGAVEITSQLEAALYSDVWWERYRAAQALVRLKGTDALTPFLTVGDRAGRVAQVLLSEQTEMTLR